MDKMMRIRGEIPTFKRCCMCLPLRYGLIVWGYIRLVIGVLVLIGSTNGFIEMVAISKKEEGYVVYIVLFGFFVILAGADIVLNVVFVYAGHTKDLMMLRAYYIYSFILWVLLLIMGISLSAYAVYVMHVSQVNFKRFWYIFWDLTSYLLHIVIQAYVTLLVRSEFIKLSQDCEFRFVNNAAESACEMKCKEEDIDNEENGHITANRYIQEGDPKYGTSEAKDALLY